MSYEPFRSMPLFSSPQYFLHLIFGNFNNFPQRCSRLLIYEYVNCLFHYSVMLKYACRVQDVAELLGMMIEDHKRLQPSVKTYV